MFSRLRHILDMAFPLLAVTAATVGAILATGVTLTLLEAQRPASVALALLGDGVDEFSVRTATFRDAMTTLGKHTDTLALLAVIATAISLIAIILQLRRSMRSAGDVRGFFSYLLDRIRLISTRYSWGTVRDGHTGHPVPLARITLVSADGRVVAKAVADMAGRYGFGIPLRRVAGTLISLQVTKGSYRPFHHAGPLPLLATGVHTADVHLDPAGWPAGAHPGTGRFAAVLAGAAFWVSVATVPLAASVVPNPLSFLLIAGLAATTLGRLCGLAMHYRP